MRVTIAHARRVVALICLILLMTGTASAQTALPSLEAPILGFEHMGSAINTGQRLTFTLTLSPQALMGMDRPALGRLKALTEGLAIDYQAQYGDISGETLRVGKAQKPLFTLTRLFTQDREWLISPDLPEALAAPADAQALRGLLGEQTAAWATALGRPQAETTWEALLADFPPLVDDKGAHKLSLAPGQIPKALVACPLIGSSGALGEWLLALARTQSSCLAHPMTLSWLQDEAGTMQALTIETQLSLGNSLWESSLTLSVKRAKRQNEHQLAATFSQGTDELVLTASQKTSLNGNKITQRLTGKLTGSLGGYGTTLSFSQQTTNAFGLDEKTDTLSEKLSRSASVRLDTKDPALVLKGFNGLALAVSEKASLYSGPQAITYSGKLSAQVTRGKEQLLSLEMPITAATGAPLSLRLPSSAKPVNPAVPQEAQVLSQTGQGLLKQAGMRLMSLLDEKTIQALMGL